jgi:hypothetical protein
MQVVGGHYPAKAGGDTVAGRSGGGYSGGGGQNMPSEQIFLKNVSAGVKARQQRIANLLSRRELAELAGIPVEHVNLFEHDLPVPLDSRRRIMKELWARKNGK